MQLSGTGCACGYPTVLSGLSQSGDQVPNMTALLRKDNLGDVAVIQPLISRAFAGRMELRGGAFVSSTETGLMMEDIIKLPQGSGEETDAALPQPE